MELLKKLIEVSKAIEYLQKDKTNSMQGYKYLSEAKIKETIKKQFELQGIVFNYSTDEIREYEISPTSKGTKQFLTIAKGTYHFYDVGSKDNISGTWFGSGSDTGDKGLYKAITGGIKYVLNTNFLIPTGDDPENDEENKGDDKDNKTTSKIGIKPKITNKATDDFDKGFDEEPKDNSKITEKKPLTGMAKKIADLKSLAFQNKIIEDAFMKSWKGTDEELIKALEKRAGIEVAA